MGAVAPGTVWQPVDIGKRPRASQSGTFRNCTWPVLTTLFRTCLHNRGGATVVGHVHQIIGSVAVQDVRRHVSQEAANAFDGALKRRIEKKLAAEFEAEMQAFKEKMAKEANDAIAAPRRYVIDHLWPLL